MVAYIRSDLDFILKQIKIAEDHALFEQSGGAQGKSLFGPNGSIPAYNLSWGLRTVDGTYNNPLHPEWGAADNEFPEPLGTDFRTIFVDPDGPGPAPVVPVSYTPGVDNDGPGSAGPSDVFDPTVRTISNLLVDQTLGNPSAILTGLQIAGIVAPANQMAVTAQISAAYAPLVPLFNAVTNAERAFASASAAASASPDNVALQDAAAAAALTLEGARAALDADDDGLMSLLTANGIELEGANIKILNAAPDEGLSAPFNSWFTLFGQFFDHGLDLVAKGGNGTVFIPLMPDDPLYVPGGTTNFMVLTRATLAGPGADGILGDDPATIGVNEGSDDTNRPVNTTTAFVDQNQTYSSHPSHQVFLRQYELNASGQPVATGKLIEGSNGGMATWGDLKAQASELLGIELTDFHVGNLPLLATDQYGNFIPDPVTGFPQVVMAGPPQTLASGTPGAPLSLVNLVADGPDADTLPDVVHLAVRTGHAFLADIAHNAVPTGLADGDIEVGLENPGNEPGVYDNELLDAHFVAGDGRANENIGLTAVHHVFHSEHNRLVQHTKDVVLADASAMLAGGATQAQAVAFLNEWLINDVAAVPAGAAIDALVWDGERVFQAAKFGTEMQYQHLVFEEFARKIQPNINVFLVPDGFDVTIDPSIVAEFAHVVYRFGHSMLTESIDRFDPEFNADHIGLIEGFLNPLQFHNNGTGSTVDADVSAGAIIRGMTRQVGNEIDEFVTGALRNNLLGLPLDLATINLARGRDTGVPSLNEARRQFYEATNEDSLLKPYESWVDFAGHLKHEASIINFIASYGTHSLITGQATIEGKRDAALTIISGVSVGGLTVPGDRLDFLNATGTYAGGTLGGLEAVDLWIGGLAEAIMPFGGMLGSTFNFVFEMQMEKLQSGDRFYYLQRLDGLHLFGEMENNSFAALIERNTNATHLPSDVFSTPGLILEVDQSRQYNADTGVFFGGADGVIGDDPLTIGIDESLDDVMNTNADPVGAGILTQLVIRNNPATPGEDTNYLRYTGGDHVVLGGTEAADVLVAGIGDDTLYGDGGNDILEGGFGNDIINAGDGDDIIRDSGGDDNIKAGKGNDVVHAGPGLDLVMGNDGQDFIFLGTDMGSEVFAGTGNDFIYGNKNAERILGNEGNDWIETGTFDGAPGDNFDEIFAHDGIDGNDVFLGDGGFDEFIGEGGDDIMVGSPGRGKMAGMSGFDWATYKDNTTGVNADLSIPIIFDEAPTLPQNAALDEFESLEGLSGTAFNDVLAGTNDVAADRATLALGGTTGYLGSGLDAQGIALISGLQAVLGAGVTSFTAGDILLGGDGNDVITGRMGDDIIDGDKWLDVNIAVMSGIGPDGGTGTLLQTHKSMTTLASQMFSGAINPGQLQIIREIKTANGAGDVDVAVFSDLRANYTITPNVDGSITVTHVTVSDGLESDGTDSLRNIERMRFSDIEISVNVSPTGAPVISDLTPTEGFALTLNTASIADGNGLGAFTYQWQSSANGTTWTNIAGATGASFTPQDLAGTAFGAQAGLQLRAIVSFTDGGGTAETVTSAPTGPVGANWDGTIFVTNTFNGTAGNDIADGGSAIIIGGVDNLNGNAGDDDLDGASGNDVINGGAGNDLITGSAGTDVAVFAGPLTNFSFATGTANTNITVTDNTGSEGVDTLNTIETLRFNGVNYGVVNGTQLNNNPLNGGAGSQAMFGFNGNDVLNGGAGSDIVHGGDGNDMIVQASPDGRDVIDGGVGTDTYQLNGAVGAEFFRIYTRAAAVTAGLTGLSTETEIVVTRNTTAAGPVTNANIIAELDNIEEITVNTLNTTANNGNNPTLPDGGTSGGDSIQVIGDFNAPFTSLNFNTITIDGNAGDDTIDITGLSSEHRIVFRANGGNDTIIGQLRPQDVIELGAALAGFETTVSDGNVTISNGTDSVTYTPQDGGPQIVGSEDDAGETPALPTPATGAPIAGTASADVLLGTVSGETIVALAGNDTVVGADGADVIRADEGNDFITAGAGNDMVFGGDGDDDMLGGDGNDMLYGDAGSDRVFADAGNDMIQTGGGNDYAYGGAGDDLFVAAKDDGDDVYNGDAGSDTLDMSVITANLTVDIGNGFMSQGSAASSQSGHDTLWGFENVVTGSGNDTIVANSSVNVIEGGAGKDTFRFLSEANADGDTITSFQAGDKIDLSGTDANNGVAGNQSFTLIPGSALSGPAQLAVTHENRADGDYTVVSGSVDGDGTAEFRLNIKGNHNLTNSDFNL
jgi:Ca2+-binding RTX toxin-like protein